MSKRIIITDDEQQFLLTYCRHQLKMLPRSYEICVLAEPALNRLIAKLDIYVQLFEAGKELSRQYEQYDGAKSWIEWLQWAIPKTAIPGVPNSGVASVLERYCRRRELEARIDTANHLHRKSYDGLPDRDYDTDTDEYICTSYVPKLKAQLQKGESE